LGSHNSPGKIIGCFKQPYQSKEAGQGNEDFINHNWANKFVRQNYIIQYIKNWQFVL
jgi:hypothetical protein